MKDTSYHDYILHDIVGGISGITSRRMFGGWGIYKDGIFFGLIAQNELYFKVDEKSLPHYKVYESRPFTYKRAGKEVSLSYWLVPEEILEDKERLQEWVSDAVRARRK
ncbi:MAG: TfoX/Sxy family protein [Candidatus Paceibacterota bacterium]